MSSQTSEVINTICGIGLVVLGTVMVKSGEYASAYADGMLAISLFVRAAGYISQRRG